MWVRCPPLLSSKMPTKEDIEFMHSMLDGVDRNVKFYKDEITTIDQPISLKWIDKHYNNLDVVSRKLRSILAELHLNK